MILPYLAIAFLALATAYSALVSFRQPAASKAGWIFPGTTSRSGRIVVGAFTVILLTTIALWLGLSTRSTIHRSSRFLIPEGYSGWIRIEFEVPGAPPLPMEGTQYILKIPSDGTLRTSSAEQYGWADDKYFFYSPQGLRTLPHSGEAALIWGKINGEAINVGGKRKYEEFFVGTREQFQNQSRE
jgi:Family of unknown function (DUF6843)